MDGLARTGFSRPIPSQTAQRTKLALIAALTLAISTMIAVTAVTIGIARADAIGAAQLGAFVRGLL